ncbi:NADH-quinone oxidoreductase subunit H [Candidatus Azambacteria bacterium]|nr:NADH-quinone oxidoreductase subunit H [Candidatus Azambacteria bacterium]
MEFLAWIIQLLIIPAISPIFVGIIRKIKAKFQNRQGASVFQPYRDLWKLMNKDEIISSDASWVFRVAPFLFFFSTLVVAASVSTVASFLSNHLTSDIIAVIYMLAIGTFFLALAGMDTGGPFGGFGASREMTVAAITEGSLLLSLFALSLLAGSTNLFSISGFVAEHGAFTFLPVILAFLGFFIAMLAETARFPFDNPATHLELTMIHEAMILEYSGKRLALMEWASANKLAIFIAFGSSLFFPVGIANAATFSEIAVGIAAFVLKALAFCLAIAVIESSISKLRFFRLPDLLFTSFILSIVAIGLII